MLRLTRKSHFCFPSNFRNSRFSISSSWRYPFKHNYTTTLQLDTLLPKEYPENSSTSASSTNSTLNTSRSHSPASPFNTTNQKSKSKWNTFDKISSLPTTSSTFSSFPPYHLDPIIISSPFTPINMQTKMKRKDKLISTNVYRNSFKINEAFAFIHVMLESGDIQRAEEIYHGLSHATLDTVQTLENTQLFNLFIKAYIQQMKQTKIDTTASLNKALLWFMKIKKRHFEPDVTSYALILHGLVFAEQEKELHAHILEVKETASPDFLEALLQHPLLLNDLSSSSYNYLNAVLASHDLRLPELSSTLSDEGNKEDLLSTSPSAQEDTKKQLYKDNEWYATQLHINSIDAVDSKGLGFLQTILKHLKVLDPHQETFQLHALQLKLETYSYMASFEKYSQTLEKAPSIALHSESIKNLLWEWHVALTAKFKEEMKSHSTFTTEDKRKTLSTLLKIDFDESPWAYLKLLSPEKLSKITIIEMLLLISKFKNGDVDPLQHISTSFCSHRLTSLLPSLGDAIANEIQFENTKKHFKEKIPDPASSYYNNYIKDFKLGSQRLLRLRFSHLRSILENNKEEPVDSTPPSSSTSTTAMTTTSTTTSSTTSTADTVSSDSEELIACLQKFPISLRAKFGGVALKLFCEICMFKRHYTHSETGAGLSETVPACYHSFEYIKNKKVGILKVTPSFLEFLCKESGYQSFPPRMLPMVVKPQPWSHVTYGGYLTRRTLCMQLKHHSVEQRAYLLEAAKRKRLNAILASLDVLGETAWQIHADVLRVVVEAWNSGEAIADFPILYTPSKIKELEPTKPDDFDNNPAAKIKYYKESQIFQTNVQNAFSLRCDNNYKLEIARSFLGYKLYFPHHIDFRGRAYPSPPLLNHMASDLSRGLLTFAESKVLGERGWFWLKVHLASLYGIDKESFSKREEWVMNHIENIFDSVDNPLSGQRWWLKCDDPWQFLAACFEVTKAIRSGNPVTYACSLPIHQDGTCNGLQHYAALGGDISGAKQVNLIKGERPADVYLAVAALVQKEIHADSNKGNELAKILDGKITRKIVKQTVMTF
ncbi:DNA-directed RNA polymerase, partial [Coelomomyces lativittatus]